MKHSQTPASSRARLVSAVLFTCTLSIATGWSAASSTESTHTITAHSNWDWTSTTVYPAQRPDSQRAEVDAEQMTDYKIYAASHGMSIEDVIRRFDGSDSLTTVYSEAERVEGISALYAEFRPDGKSLILFQEKPSMATFDQISALPFSVEVRYGAPIDSAEFFELQAEAIAAAEGSSNQVDRVSLTVDWDELAIHVQYTTRDKVDVSETEFHRIIASAATEFSIPVTYERVEELPVVSLDMNLQGGRSLQAYSPTNPVACTTGYLRPSVLATWAS